MRRRPPAIRPVERSSGLLHKKGKKFAQGIIEIEVEAVAGKNTFAPCAKVWRKRAGFCTIGLIMGINSWKWLSIISLKKTIADKHRAIVFDVILEHYIDQKARTIFLTLE